LVANLEDPFDCLERSRNGNLLKKESI
jgi:hypothetical protein